MNKRIISLFIASLATAGCGDTGQDEGNATTPVSITGTAIDGHLAQSRVFNDTNDNGRIDSWESRTFTDVNGNYGANNSFTAISGNAGTITVIGGYDTVTQEPFKGTLSSKVPAQPSAPIVVSPLTTLISKVSDTDKAAVLASLDISEEDLAIDYLASDAVNPKLFNKAVKVHKVVSVASDVVQKQYTELGNDENLPSDASGSVYAALAEQIIASTATAEATVDLNTILNDSDLVTSIVTQAETKVRRVFEKANEEKVNAGNSASLVIPEIIFGETVATKVSDVLNLIPNVVSVVDASIDSAADSAATLQQVTAGARAIEVLTQKIVAKDEVSSSDLTDIANLVDVITNTENAATKDTLLLKLQDDDIDIVALVDHEFTGTDTGEELSTIVTINESAETFDRTTIAGLQVKVSDPEMNNNTQDNEGEFYFQADGQLQACVKFVDSVDSNGVVDGEGNTTGLLATGTWESRDTVGHLLYITLDVRGITYNTTVKSIGDDPNDATRKLYRFDYLGDIRKWYSLDGMVNTVETIGAIPTTDAECEARLPTRISAQG